MARTRNYQAEYARRVAGGLARGLTRSQARGHPRITESHVSARRSTPFYDRLLEEGLKAVRGGKPFTAAARSIGVAPERLRRYFGQTGVVEKQGRRWVVGHDPRQREWLVYSDGERHYIRLPGYEPAALVGRYIDAVGQFLETNDPSVLQPFAGQSVTDVNGREYVFETRPNELYRLTAGGPESYEQIYRIVA
jgi:hypothetical protein